MKLVKKLLSFCLVFALVASMLPANITFAKEDTKAATKTYYIDAEKGNDNNDGLSEASAWKSIAKVNESIFEPGSEILFKRGQAWSGNLIVSSSGTEEAPIVYGAYGDGSERPIINGLGNPNDGLTKSCTAAVLIRDKEYVTVRDLAVTNLGTKPDGTPNDVEELGKNEELRSGIMVMGTRGVSTVLKGVKVINNEIYNVKGSSNRYPEAGTYDMYHNAGVYIWLEGTEGDIVQFDGLLIEDNIIRDMSCQGINFNVEKAADYNFKHDRYNKNVVIRENTIARTGADAIVVEYCDNILVERNVGYNAGEKTSGTRPSVIAGIWQSNANDPVFQYNECARTRFFKGDGMAWDADWGSGGTSLYQYNYSHENEGGMLMDCNFNSPNYEDWVMRYNLSVDEPGKQWTITSTFLGNVKFYNNTVYIAPGAGRIKINEKSDVKNYYTNNIFVADKIEWSDSKSEFNNNLIWGNGNEVGFPAWAVNTYYADPKFKDTSAAEVTELIDGYIPVLKTEGALDGYDKRNGWQLTSDSPAIDRGIEVTDPYEKKDLFGNDLYYGKPDIGAGEFQGAYTGSDPVEKLPFDGAGGIEAEYYDKTDASAIQIVEENNGKVVTGLKAGESVTFDFVKLTESSQSVRFVSKVENDVEVQVTVGEQSEVFTLKASDKYRKQTFDFTEEIPSGTYKVEVKVLGDGAEAFALDKFFVLPLQPKQFEAPYIYTFEENAEGWVALSGGTTTVVDQKLQLQNKVEKEYYVSELSPTIQDGIVDFDVTTGSNAKISVIVRYDVESGKFIEVGMDGVGGNYWFIDGKYDGMSHTQFASENLPVIEANRTYNIRVKMEGANFKVWIDGVQVFDKTFEGLEVGAGAVGACKWNYKEAIFDNIKVNTGTIKGRVVGSNDLGIANVSMSLNGNLSTATTDEKGYYEFKVPVKWGEEYVVSGHDATGNLEERKVVTSFENDTVEVNYKLAVAGADKSVLNKLILEAKTLDRTEYETSAWNNIQALLEEAEGLAGDVNAKQADIDAMCEKLEVAMADRIQEIPLPHTYEFAEGLEGWKGLNSGSQISVEDGQMLIKDTNRKGLWRATTIADFADGTIEYDFTAKEPKDYVGGKASIAFRMNEDGSEYLEFGVDQLDGTYWFVSGTGVNGNQVLSEAPVFTAGQTYHVKVTFVGEQITIWVDGEKLFDEVLSGVHCGAGKIGIRTWDTTEVLFDNIKVSGVEVVDTTGLEAAIEEAENKNLDEYLSAGKEEFISALEKAQETLSNPDATQEEVEAAKNALVDAMANLEMKPDKTALNEWIAKVEQEDMSKYTQESVDKCLEVLNYAKEVSNNAEATAEMVEKAGIDLENAFYALQKETVDQNPGEGSGDSPEDATNKDEVPNTGDIASYPVVLAMLFASLVLIRVSGKKRKSINE